MLTNRKRVLAAAAAAAIALTTVTFTPAEARSRGDAAILGAVAGIFGTIATIAAINAAQERYHQPYYGAPVYAPAPAYYGPAVPGPAYYGHRHHWRR